jgi:hypothetical protein
VRLTTKGRTNLGKKFDLEFSDGQKVTAKLLSKRTSQAEIV